MKRTVHTVVEIFDTVNLKNNIFVSMVFEVERTIFLCEAGQEDAMQGVCAFLSERNPCAKIEKIVCNTREAKTVTWDFFDALQKEAVDVLVDINGGNSIISNFARECCRDYDFPCIVADVENGVLINVENADEWEGEVFFPDLKFEEILMLQGRVFSRNMHMLADEKYYDRILNMSEYIFAHQSDIKFFYDFLHRKSEGELSDSNLRIVLNKVPNISERIIKIFVMLESQGFIKNFEYEDDKIVFACVEPFVKEMLAVKGSWLEMYVYILAKRSGLFTEVYQSVMVGWDLEINPRYTVENEIDVVLMKKGTPIFISCKMTNPKPDALNEIYALANSFGGYGAVPILATSSDVRNRSRTLWERSREMGIEILDYYTLNREKMVDFFKKL